MNNLRLYLLLLSLYCGMHLSYGQSTSDLIYMDQDELTYVPFSMNGQTNEVNTIPDFSHAGYMGGGVSIPGNIPIKATVIAMEGDDAPRIQAAIDSVEALERDQNGFRGVVLIKTGLYSLERALTIRASGVVLRGEGQGLNGTVLHSNQRVQHSVVSILGAGGIGTDSDSEQVIVTDYVPVGSYTFEVSDASQFQVGDDIKVTRSPNQFWIDELGMDQETLCNGKSGCVGWTPSSYTIDHERVITSISGNFISINIPIVDVIEEKFGGGSISKVQSNRRIKHCGIENIRIQSFYDSNQDEAHAWTAVRLKDAEHCWVKNVTGQYFGYSTVNIENANFTTVEDCAYIDPKSIVTGARRYSFAVQKGIGNLIQRCYTKQGRHDFVMGSRATGPNVFLDGLAESSNSDIGPHHRWATGTLFDNIRGGSIRVWNRGNSGSGHGWSGAQTMFWNLDSYNGEFRVDSPHGAMNWGIGCVGTNQTGTGYWESWGTNVQPRSLYLQQLEDRLGMIAVENITIPEQLNGEIYGLLAAWKGQGNFSDGGFYGGIPNVSFINPSNTIDVSVWEGGDIEIEATDDDGTVQNVKLLINGEPIGIDYEAPYTFSNLTATIQNLSHETHYLQAIVTDNLGYTNSNRLAILGGDPPLVEEEEEEKRSQIRIFPNILKSGEQVTIEMIDEGFYSTSIFDTQGRKVDEFIIDGIDYQFTSKNLGVGMYILVIETNQKVLFREKFVIH